MRLQVDQTGAAGKKDHFLPSLQQLARVDAADHTSAEHKDPQTVRLLRPFAPVPPVNLIVAEQNRPLWGPGPNTPEPAGQ